MNRETLLKILDLARWAPSGDNTQPWRFEIVGDDRVIVHGHDTRDHILYDFDGHASHMAHGALLETMRIAASGFGLLATWTIESDPEQRQARYDVRFSPRTDQTTDPLFPFIEKRMVQRRPMQTTPLTEEQRSALIAAGGSKHTIQLFESLPKRKQVAKLLWDNAYIRLTCPEAFPVHQEIIEWGARFSKDRIPERAVGVDPMTGKLMRWVMKDWGRVRFFNRYLMGTVAPRVQLDYLPALLCAAHLLVRPKHAPARLDDWIELGIVMQRVWLTATQQGLHLQPQMTPVIFRWYARSNKTFSAIPSLFESASQLSSVFEGIANASPESAFGFFCRIGVSQVPTSRSTRLDLSHLLR
jgi:hypothetical protein